MRYPGSRRFLLFILVFLSGETDYLEDASCLQSESMHFYLEEKYSFLTGK
jgi:hypothetical protein